MILVTGAAGHVGNVLVRELVERGEKVRAMVLPGEDLSSLAGLPVELVEADVLDPISLDRAMQGVQVVFHLAGIISILPGSERIMERVNIEGVRNVSQAALKAGVERFVHTSSIHALKRMPHGEIMDEETPVALQAVEGAYDRTKAGGTLEVLNAVRQGLDAVIVCPTGIIGPFDYRKSELGQTILSFAKNGLHFLVDGAYDFIDVRDVSRGMISAWEKGRTGEIYILSGTRVLVRELMQIVHELVGNRVTPVILPFSLATMAARIMEPIYLWTKRVPRFTRYSLQTVRDNSVYSQAKSQRELGHRPRSLRQTVADTLDWWKVKINRQR